MAEPAAALVLDINGDQVPVTSEPGIDLMKVTGCNQFKDWMAAVEPAFLVEKVHLQSVDMFGPHIGTPAEAPAIYE